MIDEDLLNTLVDLMLESVETSSQVQDKDNVMFFTWIYDELVDLPQIKNARKFAQYNKSKILKNKKDGTLTDEEIKMLHYLNQIMKATSNVSKDKKLTDKQKHARDIIHEESQKIKKDISKHMSLKEIKEFLLDDYSLTPEEKFELYYQEHNRIKEEKQRIKDEKGSMSYDDMMKSLGIKPWDGGKT